MKVKPNQVLIFFSCYLQYHRLLVLKNDIEVVQFQSNSPQYIPIAEEFWKALAKLPSVYDYTAYRKVLERFGTHYVSQGTLGGFLKIIMSIDSESEKYLGEALQKFKPRRQNSSIILIKLCIKPWLHLFWFIEHNLYKSTILTSISHFVFSC